MGRCNVWKSGLLGVLAAGLALCSGAAIAQSVDLVVSAARGDRLKAHQPLAFSRKKVAKVDFTIDENVSDQTIVGFGAAFQEAGMIAINDLTKDKQEEILRTVFDPDKGVGFSAMTTYIHATDMQAAGPYFTYADTPGDYQLKSFSIERDLKDTGLATYIKRAKIYGAFTLAARMDYPPDWLLISTRMPQAMQVHPSNYRYVSDYLMRYLEEYKKIGLDIDFVSPFAEPGNYTKISFVEIGDFIRDHFGPALAKSGFSTKIQFADAAQRALAHASYPAVLDDPQAAKYISSLSYHAYDYGYVENRDDSKSVALIADLYKRYPDKMLWMSEVSYHDGGWPTDPLHRSWIRQLPVYDFDDGDFWGNQIFSELEAGASAWTYWNLVLDQAGGPSLSSPIHGYPPINRQQALVHVDRDRNQILYTGAFYYVGHFSKFVRPGSVRVKVSGSGENIRVLAFKRPDGKRVAQVMNSSYEPQRSSLSWKGRSIALNLPARSISTYIWGAD